MCTSCDNALYLSQSLQTQTVWSMLGWCQFTKGHNSIKTVDAVMVLNLCTSSDDALYLYQVSRKYLKGSQLLSGRDLHTKIYKGA